MTCANAPLMGLATAPYASPSNFFRDTMASLILTSPHQCPWARLDECPLIPMTPSVAVLALFLLSVLKSPWIMFSIFF